MSRNRRPHLPGAAFHVTARTLDHEPWLQPGLRDRVVDIIGASFARSDATLIAYVVMPNHFHVVLRQGRLPLSHVMQRVCRGIALAVNADRGREGYVFERRYRAKACLDPVYLRDVISYVHLNPKRAALCSTLDEYVWSSHHEYAGGLVTRNWRRRPQLVSALELFSDDRAIEAGVWHNAYLDYLAWRENHSEEKHAQARRPRCRHGDHYWKEHFVTLLLPDKQRADLRDVVLRVLADQAPGLDLNLLRLQRGGPQLVRIRHTVIEQAFLAGYRGVHIARFLNISETTVSKICTRLVAGRMKQAATEVAAYESVA